MASLNLQVGDCVHYGTHGVCRVCGRESKMVGNDRKEYYTLQPTGSEHIILYLPVDAEPLKAKLRRVLSRQEILELIQEVQQIPWITDNKSRRARWNQVLRDGDTAELIGMVHAIRTHEAQLPTGKLLPMSDRELLQVAKRQLDSEFSFVLQIAEDQVLDFVLGHMAPPAP